MKDSDKIKLQKTQGCLRKISIILNYVSAIALVVDFVIRCTVFAKSGD